jgi:hypothetical protein
MTQRFINVYPASYVHRTWHDGLCFGNLEDMGYLSKRYRTYDRRDPDGFYIEWTVTGDIEFTDTYGKTYKQGDVIEWGG